MFIYKSKVEWLSALPPLVRAQCPTSCRPGSGLGCFFDDEVHKLIGLPDARFQALYHFALGSPMSDDRLQADRDPYERLLVALGQPANVARLTSTYARTSIPALFFL